jgi:hypothetical protein
LTDEDDYPDFWFRSGYGSTEMEIDIERLVLVLCEPGTIIRCAQGMLCRVKQSQPHREEIASSPPSGF